MKEPPLRCEMFGAVATESPRGLEVHLVFEDTRGFDENNVRVRDDGKDEDGNFGAEKWLHGSADLGMRPAFSCERLESHPSAV